MKRLNAKTYLYAAGCCFVLVIGLCFYFLLTDFSRSNETAYVYIDDDDNQDSVFLKLQPIARPQALSGFTTMARHTGYADNIHSGRYAIEPGTSTLKVFRMMKNGVQAPIHLTIPEARTTERLAALLSKKLMLDSAEIASALTDSTFCAKYGLDSTTVISLFIPNTYDIYWNTSIEGFMNRMVKEHDAFWNADRKTKADRMGMTTLQIQTMASIIDEETANNAEKPMIAGMYYNRWKMRNAEYPEGMPLQADPTIKFALKDFSLRRIYHKHLAINSPYNTYRNAGLPPGPIKIASVAGIDAVLNHVEHNFIYMCAKEDFSGTHNFAETYKEHQKNAAAYAHALNNRGVK